MTMVKVGSRLSLVRLIALFSAGWFCSVTLASQAAGTETLVGIVGKGFILLGADSSVSQSISLTASNLDKIAPLVENGIISIVAAAAGDASDADRLVARLQAEATIQEYQSGWGCDVNIISNKDDASNNSIMIGQAPSVHALANFARGEIATALRSQSPYKVCLLMAGMMEKSGTLLGQDDASTATSFISEAVQQQVKNAMSTATSTSDGDWIMSPKAASKATTTTKTALEPRLYWLDELGSLQSIHYGAHGYASNFCLSILDQGYKTDMDLEEATQLLKDCFQQLRTRYLINSPQPPCIKCVDAQGIRLIR